MPVPPIAIVGMSCRFPGGANSPEQFWELLKDGVDVWTPVPPPRWNEDAFCHPDPDQQGMHNHRGGHFLTQDVSAFDGGFFGISPAECTAMDPQQRLVLELSCEALENEGILREQVRGKDVGVFVAVFSQDYNLLQNTDVEDLNRYHSVGTGTAIIANRVSYILDLHGPSVTLDTGRGRGYGRGEGVGMIALKRLDDAIRDGDPIRAVIRNTGINQDGKTNGIMVPKSDAQHRLIRQVYEAADLSAQDTSVVEAHGTGTSVGDIAEVAALETAFGQRKSDNLLYVGSLKSSFGHLESASGVAGVIKGVLMLERDMIPATTNIETLKPELSLDQSGIEIPRMMMKWPYGTSRRLSVNSFGYGGTNAHAILERAPFRTRIARTEGPTRSDKLSVRQIITLSARSEQSCQSQIVNLKAWISSSEEHPRGRLEDLAYTLASHRSNHSWRMAVTVSSLGELDEVISSKSPRLVKSSQAPKTIFVFTGQGAQWYSMGRELLYIESAFRTSIEASGNIICGLGATWSLVEELQKDEDETRINESAISQPAITALQIALVELLASTNVKPDIVLGHSSGEIAAAYAAGRLSHVDAIKIAYFRGRLKSEKHGVMLAVGAGEADIAPLLPSSQLTKAVIACTNSPSSTTVSGDEEAIEQLESVLNTKGTWNRRLKVDRAYHSHHMNTVADQYRQDLRGIVQATEPTSVTFVSSVNGSVHIAFDAGYWVQNLVSKVQFHLAFVKALDLCSTEDILVVELGAHGALAGPIRQILSQSSSQKRAFSYSTLTRNRSAIDTFVELTAALFERGASVDVAKVNALLAPDSMPQVITSLPPYPWDHTSKYWHESQRSKDHRFRKFPYHDLLGLLIPGGNIDRPVWRHVLDMRSLPWLRDHVIDGEVVFPASGFICMVIEAIRQYAFYRKNFGVPEIFELKDVQFLAALALPEVPKTRTLFLHLEPERDSDWADFRFITAIDQATSVVHCPHILHPTTLDAMMHPSVAIFSRHYGGESIVVSSIASIIIKSRIASTPESILNIGASVCKTWPRYFCTEISASQATSSLDLSPELVLEQKGTVFRALSSHKSSVERRDRSYQLHWGPDVDFIKSEHIVATDSATADEDLTQATKFSALNRASTVYIQRCLRRVDKAGEPSIQHHRWLLDWMRRFSRTQEFVKLMVPDDANDEDVLEEARQLGVEGEILSRIGENLADILIAKVDSLALITDEDLLWRLYADDASTRCYGHLIRYLQHLTFKRPTMHVLEIGAGTGGATEPILNALSQGEAFPFQSYVFTDISTAFFERARVRLNKWGDAISFSKLDIQQNAADQGFIEGSFDLILASNVLHVSTSIDGALSRIKSLLKPSGRLVLIETIRNVPFYNTCLGVLPGWWAGCDDGRPDGPFLSVSQWDEAFLRNGLGGVALSAKDFDNAAHRCALLISQPLNAREPSSERQPLVQIRFCPNWTDNYANRVIDVLSNQVNFELDHVSFFDEISDEVPIIVLDNGRSPILTKKDDGCFRQVASILSKAAKAFWISLQSDSSGQIQSDKALISGFARVARVENTSLKLVTLDIEEDVFNPSQTAACFENLVSLLNRTFLQHSSEEEFMYQGGILTIPRIIPDRYVNDAVARDLQRMPTDLQPFHQPGRPLRLSTTHGTALDGVVFEEDDQLQGDLADDEVEIDVRACGVTYEDAYMMSGHARTKEIMNGEFSGTIEKYGTQYEGVWAVGDRICGFGATPFAGRIRVRGDAIAKVTQRMSFELAAALPFYYVTAWYALIDIAGLEKEQTVLIHGAHSVIGQAAIAIAQWRRSKVFAIVGGDNEQGSGLVEQLDVQSDKSSTKSKNLVNQHKLCSSGYDVVVNASRGRPQHELMETVAELGTYVDLVYNQASPRFPLLATAKGCRYAFPDVLKLSQKYPTKIGSMLSKLLSLVEKGHLRAPSISVRLISELKDVFAEVSGKLPGNPEQKIVVTTGSNAEVNAPSKGLKSLQLSADATYVIAGGLGGLGHEVAKLFARHGAKYLVLLTRRTLPATETERIETVFRDLGTNVQLVSSDITNLLDLRERLSDVIRSLPPVRGVIQSAMVLRDRVISKMTLQDFIEGTAPKVAGTQNLLNILDEQPLDFCLMLSSIVGSVVGTIAEGSYAAGNAFLSHLTKSRRRSGPRMITICPGAIDDVGILSKDSTTRSILERQGFPAVSSKQVLALIKHVLVEGTTGRESQMIISGFDYQSLEAANSPLLSKPMFSHLLRNKRKARELDSDTDDVRFEWSTLEEANSFEEIERIVLEALKKKIASLVAVSGDIDPTRSMSELGADSLVVVELKNWINQTFRTKITGSVVTDSATVTSLVWEIASQCLLAAKFQATKNGTVQVKPVATGNVSANMDSSLSNDEGALPKLPLPDLESTLQYWLKAVHVTLDEHNYGRAKQLVKAFKAPGGIGHTLQSRLSALSNNSTIDSWQEKIYNSNHHMKLRIPLVPQWNFFGTHCQSSTSHTQAERAAVITVACRNFMAQLNAAELEHEVVNEQKLDQVQYQYLFNTTREPNLYEDVMAQYPGNDHIIAFRRGHAFKIPLDDSGVPISFHSLCTLFEQIIAKDDLSESWVGVLTADSRDEWAENRSLLRNLSSDNSAWLHDIEAAAFVIYFDEAAPNTPSERGHLFLHANGFNRWSDKTVQFAITSNGYSSLIGEHSMIDGYTIRRLSTYVNQSVIDYIPNTDGVSTLKSQPLESFAFKTTPDLEAQIKRVRQQLLESVTMNDYTSFEINAVGFDFFRRHKIPPKSGVQVAIQLACRSFFGISHLAHETVSLGHFCKGRVDLNHTFWAEVKEFCDAASIEDCEPATLRSLLVNATKAHASNLMRCSRGHGIDRHLLCLEWALEEDEEMPEFFANDIYRESRPKMIVTDCLETGLLEVGSWPASENGLWIHFEPEDDAVKFSVWGPAGEVHGFPKLLNHSLELIKRVIESTPTC
ncbi:hypothetical protein N0V90_006809 [Kalmusia sp. IMI 367209]|nr:hypothetical protein N0V90_006809 [Kalmusia sp. IMI 367209]